MYRKALGEVGGGGAGSEKVHVSRIILLSQWKNVYFLFLYELDNIIMRGLSPVKQSANVNLS